VECGADGKLKRNGLDFDMKTFKCALKNTLDIRDKVKNDKTKEKCFNGKGIVKQAIFRIPPATTVTVATRSRSPSPTRRTQSPPPPPPENSFVVLYESCVDDDNKNVIYVTSKLHGASIAKPMKGAKESQLWNGVGFDVDYAITNSYEFNSQKQRIANLLGYRVNGDMPGVFANTKNDCQLKENGLCFERGHLTPRSDHLFSSWRYATFYTINSTPQWRRINSGNIEKIEDILKIKAKNLKSDLIILSGGFEICQMKNKLRTEKINLTLVPKKVPVPKWLFKIAQDPLTNQMIAFFVLNDPHVKNEADIGELPCRNLFKSNDAVERKAMKQWRAQLAHVRDDVKAKRDNLMFGYTIACTIQDVMSKISYLPFQNFANSGILNF
jgi:DNA/RNA non-specific endonuclease